MLIGASRRADSASQIKTVRVLADSRSLSSAWIALNFQSTRTANSKSIILTVYFSILLEENVKLQIVRTSNSKQRTAGNRAGRSELVVLASLRLVLLLSSQRTTRAELCRRLQGVHSSISMTGTCFLVVFGPAFGRKSNPAP